MNQFHTPSFGDEVFEMNETPLEHTQHESASRRLSRVSSLDHANIGEDDDYDTTYSYNNVVMATNQQQTPVLLEQHNPTSQQQLQQPPAKPLAPYALFFRDTMTAIKQQNPSCTLEQITAIALNMWESIDEKQKNVYDQRHEQEKREYVRQLRDYQRNIQLGETTIAATAELQQQNQQQHQQQQLPINNDEETGALAITKSEPNASSTLSPAPEQIQLLTEAATVPKCTRDQCNKPAIINPDWEDEYCSNECVVIHCRNVFSEWARSLQNSPT